MFINGQISMYSQSLVVLVNIKHVYVLFYVVPNYYFREGIGILRNIHANADKYMQLYTQGLVPILKYTLASCININECFNYMVMFLSVKY